MIARHHWLMSTVSLLKGGVLLWGSDTSFLLNYVPMFKQVDALKAEKMHRWWMLLRRRVMLTTWDECRNRDYVYLKIFVLLLSDQVGKRKSKHALIQSGSHEGAWPHRSLTTVHIKGLVVRMGRWIRLGGSEPTGPACWSGLTVGPEPCEVGDAFWEYEWAF